PRRGGRARAWWRTLAGGGGDRGVARLTTNAAGVISRPRAGGTSVVEQHQRPDRVEPEDPLRVPERDADAAVARRVVRHVRPSVDRAPAVGVAGVVQAAGA